jgi:hypothetical protein
VRRALAAALLALAASAPAAGAAERLRPLAAKGPLRTERLSDERTITRWSHTILEAVARARPSTRARRVGRLRYQTEDRRPEVYVAIRSRRTRGRVWLQVHLPGRPNGRRGWVPREALGPLYVAQTHLRIDRSALRATLTDRGRVVWESPVGIGLDGTPTPKGRWYVRQRIKNLAGGGVYGPWAFGLSAYSQLSDWPGGGVIGIHGTDQPGILPGKVSNGCVRVPNEAIERLVRLMPIGTPVEVV